MERKLFGTDGIRGVANKYPLTPELMVRIGKALAYTLKENPTVLIGKDTRVSGYMMENALTSGLVSMGATVLLVGPMPTPAIAHLTKSFAADAGIVISASHNPAKDNGIKIFSWKGIKLSDEEELLIEDLVLQKNPESEDFTGHNIGKARRIDDAKGRYIEFAKSAIQNRSLEGLKIAVDCANGASYHIAPDIFRELGAEVIVINNKPDGLNINKKCGALHPEQVRDIVLGHYADIGIAFDGDADRVIFVDEKGQVVDGDAIIMLCALALKERNKLSKDTVVATVYSNVALDKQLAAHGIKVERVACGDRYVTERLLRQGYAFGGEQSGHLIFMENSTTGDGIVSALNILDIIKNSGKKMSELASCLTAYPQVLSNVEVASKKPLDTLSSTLRLIEDIESQLGDDGRVMVRYSGTENKVRVLVEGPLKSEITDYSKQICEMIKKELDDEGSDLMRR